VRSSKRKLNNLSPDDKLEICLHALHQLEVQIKSGYTEHKGTKVFVSKRIKDFIKDKTLEINIGDFSDREFGIAMSQTTKENLRLNLSNKDWYVYDENYGTSEEKHFIQFINGMMDKLENNYCEIYLVRNANLFGIYRFSDGKLIEPDFLLFLKEEGKNNWIQYQLFIETKGTHLLLTDAWKEDFLREIESQHNLSIISAKNCGYKLIGLPFFNENLKHEFIKVFNEKLSLAG